ncbi:MAG: hypothetical protein AB8G11_10005 [Saprospiraceae bacterium]
MKRKLLIIIAMLLSMSSFSQARLGSSATEIKNEFWESYYELDSGYDSDGDYYIKIEVEKASVIYFFDSDKICNRTFILPDNQGALNYFVELYNKQYVIVSSTEWKMYSSGGIASIKLIFADDGGYYFLWQ